MRRRTVAVLAAAAFAAGALAAALIGRGGESSAPAPPSTPPHAPPRRAAKPAPPPLPDVRIAAVGDITLGRTPSLPTGGAARLLRGVRRALQGDVVLGNLETTLATSGFVKCAGGPGCFTFRAPPEYAPALRRAGFTILNVANNHAFDFGATGQAQTLGALRRAGLRHTGRPGEVTVVRAGFAGDVRRVRIAVLGFAPYDWAQSLLDLASARRLVRKAAHEADLVVVTMHAGAEGVDRTHVRRGPETYLGEPRGDVVAFAHAVVDAGADAVIGHGPHVLRGLEWYHGRLIAYSLGNFSSFRTLAVDGVLGVSAVLRLTLRPDGTFVRGRVVPLRLVGTGTPGIDPRRAAIGVLRRLSAEDFGRHGARLTSRGLLRPPRARRPSPA
jgi:hypothetical protein